MDGISFNKRLWNRLSQTIRRTILIIKKTMWTTVTYWSIKILLFYHHCKKENYWSEYRTHLSTVVHEWNGYHTVYRVLPNSWSRRNLRDLKAQYFSVTDEVSINFNVLYIKTITVHFLRYIITDYSVLSVSMYFPLPPISSFFRSHLVLQLEFFSFAMCRLAVTI